MWLSQLTFADVFEESREEKEVNYVGGKGIRWTKDVVEPMKKDETAPKPVLCPDCHGDGNRRVGIDWKTCPTCDGKGKI